MPCHAIENGNREASLARSATPATVIMTSVRLVSFVLTLAILFLGTPLSMSLPVGRIPAEDFVDYSPSFSLFTVSRTLSSRSSLVLLSEQIRPQDW